MSRPIYINKNASDINWRALSKNSSVDYLEII